MKTFNDYKYAAAKHAALENILDQIDLIDEKYAVSVDFIEVRDAIKSIEKVSLRLKIEANDILKDLNILQDGKLHP